MVIANVKGTMKVFTGKLLQYAGTYTGSNRLYFFGKYREVTGNIERKYGEYRDMAHL